MPAHPVTDWLSLLVSELTLEPRSALTTGLSNYLRILDKWQRSTNLVATSTSPLDLITLHIADSLALLPHLADSARIIDVGSGGGFPAVVVAIARPALSVTALEPAHKKHAFLSTVRRELSLANLTPLAERDDQHLTRPDFRPYDLAVSRAAFPLTDWLSRGSRLIHPTGRVLAMEGRDQAPLPPSAQRHPYHLRDRHRAIIEWRP